MEDHTHDQPENQQSAGNNSQKIAVTVAILLVAVLLVVGVKAFSGDSATDNASSVDSATNADRTTVSENASSNTTNNVAAAGSYQDGEYTATGTYQSPGGNEKITISVTLDNGKITDTGAVSGATDREGKEYQSQFISAYKELVVGKSIDDIKLSRVSGSSLTSQGFNNALSDIKQQAKS